MPKIRPEDKQFAVRLGLVLRELRAVSPWPTQEKAAEGLGFNSGTYGRWERGDYAPKGYDLGRLFRGYQPYGARWQWFFDPPEVVVINPVRARLAGLADLGTSEGQDGEGAEPEGRRQVDDGPGGEPARRSA